MAAIKIPNQQISPVAIGGVGGSGTRLIANCLEELNYDIGSDLNQAKDNLWFTLLFKHIEILEYTDEQLDNLLNIFLQGMLTEEPLSEAQISTINELIHDKRHLPKEFFKKRMESLILSHNKTKTITNWGWKEPNTHIILDRLIRFMPKMKYIHVMRNGLDMAHSANQNQQFLWGKKFVGNPFEQSPYFSLKYWCIVHRRLLEIAKPMGNNFLLLNYDDFCTNPKTEIPKLLEFLSMPINDETVEHFSHLIKAPASIGRYKAFGTTMFDLNDLHFVEKLGFSV